MPTDPSAPPPGTPPAPDPGAPLPLPRAADLRLVAVDLDGTLLTPDHELPEGFWDLLADLDARGITLVPASGRQFASIRRVFGARGDHLVMIAENGGFVGRGEERLAVRELPARAVGAIVEAVRDVAREVPAEVVRCGVGSAWIEHDQPGFMREVRRYYAKVGWVPDVLDVDDPVMKIAVLAPGRSTHVAGRLAGLADDHRVLSSGPDWVDIMPIGVDKGHALRDVQAALGVTPEQTVAFGDYLNDLGMFDAARWTYAMPAGHPDVIAAARGVAPSNAVGGVVQVMRAILAG